MSEDSRISDKIRDCHACKMWPLGKGEQKTLEAVEDKEIIRHHPQCAIGRAYAQKFEQFCKDIERYMGAERG